MFAHHGAIFGLDQRGVVGLTGRDLVNWPMWSLSSRPATRWLMDSEPLSAWKAWIQLSLETRLTFRLTFRWTRLFLAGQLQFPDNPTLFREPAEGQALQESPERILITGHPRSGTKFTANMLKRMGYPTSYEGHRLGKSTRFVSSWKHAMPGVFEYRYFASMRLDQDFAKTIHQVRHPLKVISSSTTLFDLTIDHIKKHVSIPEQTVHKNQPLRLCMRSWIGWNRLIEERADWRYRLEELPEIFPEFCRQLGIPEQPMPTVGKRNTRRHDHYTWDDLYREDECLAEEIWEMALRYGYRE